MTKSSDIGHLVVTLGTGIGGEAVMVHAHSDAGPVPVYFEVAPMKACRCGCTTHKVRVRVVAPKSVRLQRVPNASVPE